MGHHPARRAFTLIEIMIVMGIVALLAAMVLYLINPVELFAQARDSGRISNLNTLKVALELVRSDQLPLGTANTLYVSVPDPTAPAPAGNQCQGLGLPILPSGWTYHCAASSTYLKTDGTGWLPVNFSMIPGGGSPISILPVDPTNATSSDLYYTYGVGVGNNWELTAVLESKKDVSFAINDGCPDPAKYELGTCSITTFAHQFAGYWPFEEGAGTMTADLSGYNATGTITNPVWTAGKIGGALDFSAGNAYVDFGVQPELQSSSSMSITAWIYADSWPSDDATILSTTDSSVLKGYQFDISQDFGTRVVRMAVRNNTVMGAAGRYGTIVLNTGQWYFVAGVYNAATQAVDVYLNGQLNDGQFVGTPSSSQVPSGIPTRVADKTGLPGAYPFLGVIDQVRVYDRPLTATQIQAIYAAMQ